MPDPADTTEPSGLDPAESLDRRRGRTSRNVLLGGAGVTVAGTVLLGALGVGGRASLVGLFVGFGAAAAVSGAVGLVTALLDEWRGHRVSRRRLVVAGLSLLCVPVLFALAAGAAGGAGGGPA